MGIKIQQTSQQSILNLRELGGMTTLEGKRIRHQRIYRSGNPHRSRTMKDPFELLEIQLVIDLRSIEERQLAKFVQQGSHKYLHIALDFESMSLNRKLTSLLSGGVQSVYDTETILNYMKLAAGSFDWLSLIFKQLSNPQSYPLLIHCEHGKDRTGFVIALLLKLLNVSDEDIVEEYLRSKLPQTIYSRVFRHDRHKSKYLSLAMSQIEREYRSWPAFFEFGLSLQKDEQEQIKSLILE